MSLELNEHLEFYHKEDSTTQNFEPLPSLKNWVVTGVDELEIWYNISINFA